MTTTTATLSITRLPSAKAPAGEATILRRPMAAAVAAAALLWLGNTLLVMTGAWQPPIPGSIGGSGGIAATEQIADFRD